LATFILNATLNGCGTPVDDNSAARLHDVAFQHFVVANAYPDMDIDAHLMLTNKSAKASTDGLNTKFKIIKTGNNRKEIEVSDLLSEQDLKPKLLSAVNVSDILTYIYEEESFEERSFESHIAYLASIYENDTRVALFSVAMFRQLRWSLVGPSTLGPSQPPLQYGKPHLLLS
jgi:hypothetical protein